MTDLLIVTEGEHEIPVSQLKNNPNNPRKEVGDVTDLAASIRTVGLIEALNVNPNPTNPAQYWIAAGERRWVAMKFWAETIRCHVSVLPEGVPPAKHQLIVGLVENGQRKNLNPIERAKAYERLRKEFNMTLSGVAGAVGVSEGAVSTSLLLLDLAPRAQQAVAEGKLTVKDATTIVRTHRAQLKKKVGQQPQNIEWLPPSLTSAHFLARAAKRLCDSSDHGGRFVKLHDVACEYHWERAIRDDEAKVQRNTLRDQGFDVPFQSPVMAAVGNSIGQGGPNA